MNIRSIILLTIISLVLSIAFLKIKVDQIHIGYNISENNKKEKSLIQERQKLRAELSNLKSPYRLELIADRLGFRFPTQNDIFHAEKITIAATENEKNKKAK